MPTWIHGSVFLATTLFVISLFALAHEMYFRYRQLVAERMRELLHESDEHPEASIFKGRALSAILSKEQARTSAEWLQDLIDQAGLTWKRPNVIAACLVSGLLFATVLAFRIGWAGCLFFPLGTTFPLSVLFYRRNWRRRRLGQQLPEVFQIISRAVRAGQTVPAALQIVADDFEPPISWEFAQCYEQQNLGMSRESALKRLAQRTGIMELQIFVVALLVQSRSGGDLVELLDNLSTMASKRLRLRDRVRALTGEARIQAIVLMVLPVVAFACLLLFSPDYVGELTQRPKVLCGMATAQLVGALWIRKIVSFDA